MSVEDRVRILEKKIAVIMETMTKIMDIMIKHNENEIMDAARMDLMFRKALDKKRDQEESKKRK